MELQEKSVLAQEKPRYDAIPLTTFDKTGKRRITGSCRYFMLGGTDEL